MGITVRPHVVNDAPSLYSRASKPSENIPGTPNFSPNCSSSASPPGGSQSSGFGVSRPGPNIAPNVHGTRSPQWSRWKCVITIASTRGQPSCSRRRGSTPGPQSSSSRPLPSTRYPDCAPPGFGQAGEQPTIVSFTVPVWHSPRVAEGAVDLLQRVPLFSDLDRKELERIATSMKQRTFDAGETVTAEGSSGVGFFVIESGNAKVTIGGEDRRRLGPGDYFGEVALLNESARTATITAESDLKCYGLTSWEFRPLVETQPSIAWKLLQAMSKTYQSR